MGRKSVPNCNGRPPASSICSCHKKIKYMETSPLGYSSAHVPTGNDKIWTILSHLSLFVGLPFFLPFVVYLAMRNDSEYVAANAREALNFHLTVLIYCLCCIPLVFLFIGVALLAVISISALVLAVLGAIAASKGECYRYPMTLRLI